MDKIDLEDFVGAQNRFDDCVLLSIKIGRKYMQTSTPKEPKPTKEEWRLALLLFEKGYCRNE